MALTPKARDIYRMHVACDYVLDLRAPAICVALHLIDAPICFQDPTVARATAHFLRAATPTQALLVPSMGFLDQLTRWNLVLFLEKLPPDPRAFLTEVERVGMLALGPEGAWTLAP
jgi:hypothetical protein